MARLPDHPTVSVIICSYNRYAGLLRAIASVRAQTYRPFELIVVDDGSTDRRYAAPHPAGVIWLRAECSSRERCGFPSLGHVKNLGIARATGDWLAFLDDDDEWFPPKLARQVAALGSTGCRMASTEALRGRGRFDARKNYPRYLAEWARPAALPERFTRREIEQDNLIIHSSVLIERALLLEAGGYDELPIGGVWRDGRLLVEDWELWKRCLRATDCTFLPEPLLYYDSKPSVYSGNRLVAGATRMVAGWRARVRRALA